jgi:hypothetical protein
MPSLVTPQGWLQQCDQNCDEKVSKNPKLAQAASVIKIRLTINRLKSVLIIF